MLDIRFGRYVKADILTTKASIMVDLTKLSDKQILAVTGYGEARGEPIEGIVGVMSVIKNRVREGRFGKGYSGVCLKPKQFSCWNEDDPNRPLLLSAAESLISGSQVLPRALELCLLIAGGMVREIISDNTKGSNHYLTRKLYNDAPPSWAKGKTPKALIGNHIFLQL
jgi:N-acetylmuramoyl-L-alanine amidase